MKNCNPSDWDAPKCLRFLYSQTGELNFLHRADSWAGEVARFAAYEGVEPNEWEEQATEELRAAVRKIIMDDVNDGGDENDAQFDASAS